MDQSDCNTGYHIDTNVLKINKQNIAAFFWFCVCIVQVKRKSWLYMFLQTQHTYLYLVTGGKRHTYRYIDSESNKSMAMLTNTRSCYPFSFESCVSSFGVQCNCFNTLTIQLLLTKEKKSWISINWINSMCVYVCMHVCLCVCVCVPGTGLVAHCDNCYCVIASLPMLE